MARKKQATPDDVSDTPPPQAAPAPTPRVVPALDSTQRDSLINLLRSFAFDPPILHDDLRDLHQRITAEVKAQAVAGAAVEVECLADDVTVVARIFLGDETVPAIEHTYPPRGVQVAPRQ